VLVLPLGKTTDHTAQVLTTNINSRDGFIEPAYDIVVGDNSSIA